ncbi:MAG: GNAT family N-acetyltransferase [Candidatus Bathyarchaeota archaeon]|nr:GNAT family N-acetyltransferase [Candidatus Bathyarchaeum tardum]WGM90329.1 MAG: GNAT family N-acetyltransferase [Candidatus Bathyarchaeum tardum]WNZ29592.1 MAG: GNAT family N-acetyltransferase [Candidatus Bathyarchaeota archaeon]
MITKYELKNGKKFIINVKIITNLQDVIDKETVWNSFVSRTENPLLYSKILVSFMQYCEQNGWTPLIFTFWCNNQLIGIAPLKMKRSFYSNQISSLREDLYSDFVFLKKYRKQCMALLVDAIFTQLRCRFASVTFDSRSPNLKRFEEECLKKKLKINKKQDLGRAVIPLEGSYNLFYSSLKNEVRKEFQRNKRRLDDFGSWKIVCVPINAESIKTVFKIEQKSWKETWREKNDIKEDFMLRIFLESSQSFEGTNTPYASEVWFLEVNGKAIAYQIVFLHNDVSIFLKTSFNWLFRKFGAGKFLMNSVIRETYKNKSVKKIDFITNLPLVQTWNAKCEPRTRVIVDVNPFLSRIFHIITSNRTFRKIGFKLKF